MFMEAKVSLATILKLAATGSIYVNHEPRTKRYGRAEIHLNAIIQYGVEIGKEDAMKVEKLSCGLTPLTKANLDSTACSKFLKMITALLKASFSAFTTASMGRE
jgi:hypothetical protein